MLRPARKSPAQKAHQENPMNNLHYIGFDVYKKTISFCVKTVAGEIVEKGSMLARRGLGTFLSRGYHFSWRTPRLLRNGEGIQGIQEECRERNAGTDGTGTILFSRSGNIIGFP